MQRPYESANYPELALAQYIIRRLLALIPVLLGVSIVVFLLIRMIPGDPVIVMLGERARLEDVERVRHEMGFDRPIHIQYIEWMGRVLRGDLGKSIIGYTQVMDALKQNTWVDTSAMFVALIGVSLPIYWLALMLIYALAVNNRIFPPSQRLDVEFVVNRRTGFMMLDTLMMGDFRMFANAVWHLILPSFVLSTTIMPIIARLTRSSMLEVLRQDYVRTARAKGLQENIIVIRHALKNAMLPVVTVVGLQLGALLGGALLTETLFSWPGMGSWTYGAILSRDYPIVQAAVLASATIYVFVNLFVDISYAYLDPRIRYR
jgi:peptide/nickel transport system permease protein